MSKIHGQTWTMVGRWSIRDAETRARRAEVYTDHQTPEEADEVARLITATPDMVRALLEVVDAEYSPLLMEDAVRTARAALSKAGVLPEKLTTAPTEAESEKTP